MALGIRTFDETRGGHVLFKALGHPEAAPRAAALVDELAKAGRVAIYDPDGSWDDFHALYRSALAAIDPIAGAFVQRLDEVGRQILGCPAAAVSELPSTRADVLFVTSFDPRSFEPIAHLVPGDMRIVGLDRLRLADAWLANPAEYLDPLNFATNHALFRDSDGHHTRLRTANYWHRHGARRLALWLCLFDAEGNRLAQWTEPLPDSATTITIDSAAVRERFGLGPFTGTLFLHTLRAAGHDVVKYALDTYVDGYVGVSSTHDANAWPADRYAGLPAPRPTERVVLWIQNSHPAPIPAGAITLNAMGRSDAAAFVDEVPAFGTRAIDVGRLLPDVRWPAQLEVTAGRHFVRPRYEVVGADGARRIAHANVQRTDLRPDPEITRRADQLGKGFILPAPVLDPRCWTTTLLPTPMATTQREQPLQLRVFDASGNECLCHSLGRVRRDHRLAVRVDALLAEAGVRLEADYGHLELGYDLAPGDAVDGWLHALFRYERVDGRGGADTSFGSHLYNVPFVFGREPQSYSGPPPGLRTRLFVRFGFPDQEVLCHLIYPVSRPWQRHSSTRLLLHDAAGTHVAERRVAIPQSGSLQWSVAGTFDERSRQRAGRDGYVIVRDETCRLFGYQALLGPDGGFSLDHLFGF